MLVICFHKQQLTLRNVRQQCVYIMRSVHLHRHDVLTVPSTVLLHCPTMSLTCTLSYYYSNWAGGDQSCLRILLSIWLTTEKNWPQTKVRKLLVKLRLGTESQPKANELKSKHPKPTLSHSITHSHSLATT